MQPIALAKNSLRTKLFHDDKHLVRENQLVHRMCKKIKWHFKVE